MMVLFNNNLLGDEEIATIKNAQKAYKCLRCDDTLFATSLIQAQQAEDWKEAERLVQFVKDTIAAGV